MGNHDSLLWYRASQSRIRKRKLSFYAENKRYSEEDEDGEVTTYTVEHSYFCHQITPVRYEVIDITNFTYANLIYKGKSVVYSGLDALNGSDEPNETGLLFLYKNNLLKNQDLFIHLN